MAVQTKTLFPPDESVWQKYSPHFEAPLAGATSLFLHGTVIGMMAIGGMAFFWAASQEASKPPRMGVVMIEGDGGGFEGSGAEQGLPGKPDAGGKRTEIVSAIPNKSELRSTPNTSKDPEIQLGMPLIEDGNPPVDSDLAIELARIAKEADDQIKQAMNIPKAPETASDTKKIGPVGTNTKGLGGKGGSGDGSGIGNKQGTGKGKGGFSGRPPTKQEVYAMRWHFDLSGDAKEHARKLAAIGFTLAIPDPRGGFVVVTDLNRRPVEIKKEDLAAYKDAVKWYNTKRESVQSLAKELQLPFVPPFVVLLLPQDREEQMAAEEARFATEKRRNLKAINMTQFDFRLRNGSYDAAVIQQK